ncbi:MAG: hypothetical protein HYY18_11460 [Planctomycetes bacterium]|nr:hypothetical protein [Planctomycetota bacterium]
MRRYRPREWFRQNNAFIAGLPFARSRGLRQGETLARFVAEAWRLGNLLFRKSTLRKLRLDVTAGTWAARHAKIGRFLALPVLDDQSPPRADLAKFAGVYDLGEEPFDSLRSLRARAPRESPRRDRICEASPTERARLTVRLGKDGTLIARFRNWLPHVRLLPRKPRVFTLAGLPCELSFQLDRSGAVGSATAHGIPSWELSGKTFVRRSGSGPADPTPGGRLRPATGRPTPRKSR